MLASKGGVPGAQVVARYKDIVGESVPYRKFNFSNLENFLQSIPDVCRIIMEQGRDMKILRPKTVSLMDIETIETIYTIKTGEIMEKIIY